MSPSSMLLVGLVSVVCLGLAAAIIAVTVGKGQLTYPDKNLAGFLISSANGGPEDYNNNWILLTLLHPPASPLTSLDFIYRYIRTYLPSATYFAVQTNPNTYPQQNSFSIAAGTDLNFPSYSNTVGFVNSLSDMQSILNATPNVINLTDYSIYTGCNAASQSPCRLAPSGQSSWAVYML